MKYIKTALEGVFEIIPEPIGDSRGYFCENYVMESFNREVCNTVFVQDNESLSRYGVLRGLHYQLSPYAQGKLVRVIKGRIIDVAVDLRKGSPTFGRYVSAELSEENRKQFFVPRGFAHGFAVLSSEALVQYKCDNYYSKEHERGISFDDPSVAVEWGLDKEDMVLSEKDLLHSSLYEAELFNYNDKLY